MPVNVATWKYAIVVAFVLMGKSFKQASNDLAVSNAPVSHNRDCRNAGHDP